MIKKIGLVLGVLAACSMMIGCSYLKPIFDCDPGTIEDLVEAAEEIIEQIPTPAPDQPTPTPTPAVTHHLPEFYCIQNNSELPIGVCVATENYVPGEKDKGSSIAIKSVLFANHFNPARKTSVDWRQMPLYSPAPAFNWNTSLSYAYTTRYATNPDTGFVVPGADGTSRGIAAAKFEKPGVWDVYVTTRNTENRGTAFIAVTIKDESGNKTSFWWKWYQRGDGSTNQVRVGTKARFIPKG
jgi:hypothetical protein